MCTGACLRATAQNWSQTGLGPVLTPLLLGLRRLLLRCRNHLEHDVLNGGCYTNAYEIIECSTMMQLLYFNWNVLRTVCAQVADRPRYNSADPPEPTTSLDKFQSIQRTVRSNIVYCPQFNSAIPPEATTPLDEILISAADRPALLGGPSAVHSANSTRDDNVSGHNSRLYGGLSALQ